MGRRKDTESVDSTLESSQSVLSYSGDESHIHEGATQDNQDTFTISFVPARDRSQSHSESFEIESDESHDEQLVEIPLHDSATTTSVEKKKQQDLVHLQRMTSFLKLSSVAGAIVNNTRMKKREKTAYEKELDEVAGPVIGRLKTTNQNAADQLEQGLNQLVLESAKAEQHFTLAIHQDTASQGKYGREKDSNRYKIAAREHKASIDAYKNVAEKARVFQRPNVVGADRDAEHEVNALMDSIAEIRQLHINGADTAQQAWLDMKLREGVSDMVRSFTFDFNSERYMRALVKAFQAFAAYDARYTSDAEKGKKNSVVQRFEARLQEILKWLPKEQVEAIRAKMNKPTGTYKDMSLALALYSEHANLIPLPLDWADGSLKGINLSKKSESPLALEADNQLNPVDGKRLTTLLGSFYFRNALKSKLFMTLKDPVEGHTKLKLNILTLLGKGEVDADVAEALIHNRALTNEQAGEVYALFDTPEYADNIQHRFMHLMNDQNVGEEAVTDKQGLLQLVNEVLGENKQRTNNQFAELEGAFLSVIQGLCEEYDLDPIDYQHEAYNIESKIKAENVKAIQIGLMKQTMHQYDVKQVKTEDFKSQLHPVKAFVIMTNN